MSASHVSGIERIWPRESFAPVLARRAWSPVRIEIVGPEYGESNLYARFIACPCVELSDLRILKTPSDRGQILPTQIRSLDAACPGLEVGDRSVGDE
jgi:hypothetical protein